jgi:branched-chain amino acid transport system substrate-binding protein
MRSIKWRGLAVAATLAIGAVGAGCGSNDSSGSSSKSSSSGAAAKKLTGDPVKIAVLSEETGPLAQPGKPWVTGAKAAADYINNDLGGFGGRPVQIVTCDTKGDPGATLACANKTAADGVVTTVGLSINFGANGLNVYKKHNIPSMNAPVSAQDFADPDSFPIGGGILSEFTAGPRYMAEKLGAKHIVVLVAKAPTVQVSLDLMKAAFLKAGGQKFDVSTYPPGAADLTSAVAKATSAKPDMVYAVTSNADGPRVYQALAQQGWPAEKIMNQGGAVDDDTFFSKAGNTVNNSYFSYEFHSYDETANADVRAYRGAMKKYANGTDGRGEFFQWPFANVMTVYNAAKQIGFAKFDATSLKDYLSKTEGVPIFMGNKLADSAADKKTSPSIRNPFVRFVQLKDGKLTDIGGGWVKGGI